MTAILILVSPNQFLRFSDLNRKNLKYGVDRFRQRIEFIKIGLILFLNGNNIATEELRMVA